MVRFQFNEKPCLKVRVRRKVIDDDTYGLFINAYLHIHVHVPLTHHYTCTHTYTFDKKDERTQVMLRTRTEL